MFNKRNSGIYILLIVILAAMSAGSVMAQDDTTTWPYGSGGYGIADEPMGVTVAEALGMTFEDYWLAIRSGQTVETLAAANGVDLQTIYNAVLAEREANLAALVAAGTITQAQADAHLAWIQSNIGTMPMYGGGFGGAGTGFNGTGTCIGCAGTGTCVNCTGTGVGVGAGMGRGGRGAGMGTGMGSTGTGLGLGPCQTGTVTTTTGRGGNGRGRGGR